MTKKVAVIAIVGAIVVGLLLGVGTTAYFSSGNRGGGFLWRALTPQNPDLSMAILGTKKEMADLPGASVADFRNAVSADKKLEKEGRGNIFRYYVCLRELQDVSDQKDRKDLLAFGIGGYDFNLKVTFSAAGSMEIATKNVGGTLKGERGGEHEMKFRSEALAFTEIPRSIYLSELERLGKLVTKENQSVIGPAVRAQIKSITCDLPKMEKFVRGIVTGEFDSQLRALKCGNRDIIRLREEDAARKKSEPGMPRQTQRRETPSRRFT